MNYDKIKSLEEAIKIIICEHDCDPNEAIAFLEKCFTAKRVEHLQETRIKQLGNLADSLDKEIRRHKTCIENLRGYIAFLEQNITNKEEQEERDSKPF